MRRFILSLTALLIAGNVFASDLKVGDRMPLFDLKRVPWERKNGLDKQGRYVGPVAVIDSDGDGESDAGQVYTSCNGSVSWKFPFIIYDFIKNKAYIDNNLLGSRNGKPTDGYIDQIRDLNSLSEEEQGLYYFNPGCMKGFGNA